MLSTQKYTFPVLLFVSLFLLTAATFILPAVKIGDPAPGFTLYKLNGDSVRLSDYKGKVTVIHLWSHTCPHCRLMNQTLPDVVKPYKKSNLAYIMIDIDTDTTGWRTVIKEDHLNFAIHAIDPKDAAAKTFVAYDGHGTPCINIADENGKLIAVNLTTNAELKKILKKRFPL